MGTDRVVPGVRDLTVTGGVLEEIDVGGPLEAREIEVRGDPGVEVRLAWRTDLRGAVGCWSRWSGDGDSLQTNWAHPWVSSLASGAPVALLFDASSRCTHAFAVSETVAEVTFRLGVSEERGDIEADVRWTLGNAPTRVRFYPAGAPYQDVLADVSRWWAEHDPWSGPGTLPAVLPPAATEPVYSTWYAMHQHVEQHRLDAELDLAADLGMRAVVVDDGWQTDDGSRGYAFTGDWHVEPSRFGDLAEHVRRTHRLGLAELLWVSLPFVGRESEAYRRLSGLLLPEIEGAQARLWDVRLPAARDHVAGICRRLVADHDLDGLKIDFVDEWSSYPPTPRPAGADTASYAVGVDRLLGSIIESLRAVVEAPLVEFRQPYAGPRMQRYGNLFRVGDCPANGRANRVGSVDLRHLVRDRAVHSDMVLWTADGPPEHAAEQLLCTAFAVPQISMLLRHLPSEHLTMLRAYLAWWRAYRATLLGGRLTAPRPDLAYPVVTAALGFHSVTVAYAENMVARVPPGQAVVANATGSDHVTVHLAVDSRLDRVSDCFGRTREAGALLPAGLHLIRLPRGGHGVLTSESGARG